MAYTRIIGRVAPATLREQNKEFQLYAGLLVTACPVGPNPGVYLLINEYDEIVYVGQSECVATRLAGHSDKDYTDARMLYYPDKDDRDRHEAALIRLLQPRYNVSLLSAFTVTEGGRRDLPLEETRT